MKKLLTLLLIAFSITPFAQEIKDPQTPTDSTKKPNNPSATLNNQEDSFLNRQNQPSPNAGSLGKYADFPVNYNSGLPEISIPITTVKGSQLSLPISLSYHGGGVRVAEVASWVGLNWALNAGGVITRQIFGGPDESYEGGNKGNLPQLQGQYTPVNSGFYSYGGYEAIPPFIENNTNINDYFAKASHIMSASYGLKDMEPDIFSYNIGGKAGKFFFDVNRVAHFFPKLDVNVEVDFNTTTKQFVGFILTNDDGIRYYFGGTNYETSVTSAGTGSSYGPNLKSSWFLYKIESADRQDVINLEYIAESSSFHNLSTEQGEASSASRYSNISKPFVTNNTISGQRLSRIYSNKMEVKFRALTAREDVLLGPKRLDTITIKNTVSGSDSIKFKLLYDYTESTDNLPAFSYDDDKKRLRLLSLQEFSGDESISKPKYEFGYDATLLPRRLSYGRDHGGFYNGVTNNNTLVHPTIPNLMMADRVYNRSVNWNFGKAGHLKEIKWPTGGKTEYIFQENGNNNPGQRIHQIKAYLGNAEVVSKTYTYSTGTYPFNISDYYLQAYHFVGTSGVGFGDSQKTNDWMNFTATGSWNASTINPTTGNPIGYLPLFDLTTCNTTPSYASTDFPATTYASSGEFFLSSDLYGEIKGLIGQNVTYNQVVETTADGGFIEYHYPTLSPYFLSTSYSFPLVGNPDKMYFYVNQGKLTYEGHYKPGNIKVKEIVYDYKSLSNPETQTAYRMQSMGCNNQKVAVSKYTLPKSTRSLLTKKTETTYDQSGSNGVVVVTNHLYGANHEQPITTSMNRSNGDSLVTETKFVKDYTEVDNYNSGFGYSIYAMQVRNINAPVESLTFVKKTGETNATMKAIAGRITKFDSFESNANNLKPKEIFSLKIAETPISVTRSTANNNLLTIDGNYEKRAEFNYNGSGLLQTERLADGATTNYYYSGTGLLTSKVEASGTGIAQTTSFVHNDLFGLKQITEPNGLIKTFDYDKLGRLALIKDNNGDILSKNTYEYGANNRVGTYLARIKTTSPVSLNTPDSTVISYQYFDGLGREIQKIGFKASPLGNDIASDALTYDLNGRPKLSYLPYPTTLSTGGYQSDNQGKAKTFYNNDDNPYSETFYEASALNRPNEQFGPGAAWRNDKSVKMEYATAGSTIPLYKISGTTISYNSDGKFPSNSLFKITKTDEESHSSVEITDIEGKVIQKQVQGPSGYMTTHYVYNDLNELKAVIQPEAYPLTANLAETDDTYKGNVFFYKYDNRKRIISKKVPAADEEFMAYDRWDRLVLSQSGMQRADGNRWSFYKYDALNREIYRGEKEYGGTSDPTTLQASAMASTTVGEVRTNSLPFYDGNCFPSNSNTFIAQINFFDNYDNWKAAELNFVSAQTPHEKITNTTGLLTGAYVRNLIDNDWLKMANYYDNKSRLIQSTKTNHLSGGNAEVMSTEYNFAGEPVVQKMIHKKTGKPDLSEKTMFAYDHVGRNTQVMHFINDKAQNIAVYEHDEIGRQKTKKINAVAYVETKKDGNWDNPAVWKGSSLPIWNNTVKINHNITVPIDFLGFGGTLEMSTPSNLNMLAGSIINLNGESNNWPYLQKIDYDYHIRGGLLGINLDGNKNTSLSADNDLFSYKLNYGFDGNISRQEWQHSGTNETRSYDFGYDQASRLTSANYSPSGTYSTSNTYDNNGNILTMNRNAVDQLTYNYEAGRLKYVNDGISGNSDVGDFRNINTGTNDYEYAEDGSLKADKNKGIDNVNYNSYLKKARQVNLSGGKWIKFEYDGSGNLLKRSNSDGDYFEYAGSLIYKNGEYYQMNTAEGRAINNAGTWNYEYNYADIWGNLRHTFTVENGVAKTKQISDFDPWGWEFNKIVPTVKNNFKYQKQERVDDFGVGIDLFKFRPSDYQIGRFWSVDPLASDYTHNSVYAFQENKFGLGIEKEGKELENFESRFKDPSELKEKVPNKNESQIQIYSSTVKDSKLSFKEMKEMFFKTPEKLLSNSKAEFHAPENSKGEKTGLTKGNTIEIEIDKPANDSYVKIHKVTESENKVSATFVTLEGHVEKGVINFTLENKGDNSMSFTIGSMSQVDYGILNLNKSLENHARGEQKASWVEVLNNFVNTTGGKEVKKIIK